LNDELIAEAEIGDEAKNFLESDLGKCVLGMAQQDAEAATAKLKTVDPEDAKAVRSLQNEIWKAETFGAYVAELFTRGENALQAFIQQRGNE
jgi:hypothetical protein